MALEIRKQEHETTQGLIRRFTKKLQQSGILVRARRVRFRAKKESEMTKRENALIRERMKKHYKKMAKMGKQVVSGKKRQY
jgi:ribosomal protein S21